MIIQGDARRLPLPDASVDLIVTSPPYFALRSYTDNGAPTRPSVILDPFAGTGTTVLVARALGRIGVGVDMSADYCRLAQWRTSDRGELARAMRVEKPPLERAGQLDLFGEAVS